MTLIKFYIKWRRWSSQNEKALKRRTNHKSHKARYLIKILCDLFDVHHSSYKYWCLRDTSLPPEKIKLRFDVKSANELSGGSAGACTIAEILMQRGFQLSRYHATRFMKDLELVSCQLPQHAYKKSSKEHMVIPNLLERQFDTTEPNQVWCGDVTSIWTGNRRAYLAVVIDLFARKSVG